MGLVLLMVCLMGCGPDQAARDREFEAVRQAARQYLEAEARGDLEAVYYLIAPGSEFRRSYTLDQYRTMVDRKAPRITDYRLERVADLVVDPDRKGYPHLEMTANVTVKVWILDPKVGVTAERTNIFTFVKEKGVWYKG